MHEQPSLHVPASPHHRRTVYVHLLRRLGTSADNAAVVLPSVAMVLDAFTECNAFL